MLAFSAGVLALQPTPPLGARAVTSRSGPIACSAIDRRSAVFGALGCGLLAAVPAASVAYDAIPEVKPDFAKLEQQRAEQAFKDRGKIKILNEKVKALESASKNEEFVAAADDLALWVVGEKRFPDGVKVKELVNRIKLTYDDMPIIKFKCKETRSGICTTHDPRVEDTMTSLMNEMRKSSMIQLGDYRKVEFRAF